MTCDFCGSFLHLWKDCRDRQEHRETRIFKTYANIEDFDEDGYEQEGHEAYDHHDVEVTPESEAFVTHHLPDLGLKSSSNIPRSRNKKNSSLNFYTDANITLYTSQTYNNIPEKDKYDMKKMLLLDTGCVRTVCGRRWLAHCMATMDQKRC